MRVDAEKFGPELSHGSGIGDTRLTKVGAILRRHHIDELPQLWNVFLGDMAFVGPRPDVPGYADKLEGDDRDVLKMLPGITGPATLKYLDISDESNLDSKGVSIVKYIE